MARPNREKISLATSDWDDLFPKKSYKLAKSTIDIYPLSLEEINGVILKLRNISQKIMEIIIQKKEFTENNVVEILDYVTIILQESPEILSDMSGIVLEDIKALPLSDSIELFSFCLDLNIQSQESLVKNFKGLAEKVQKFTNATM